MYCNDLLRNKDIYKENYQWLVSFLSNYEEYLVLNKRKTFFFPQKLLFIAITIIIGNKGITWNDIEFSFICLQIPVLSTLSSTATPSATQPKLVDIVHETIHDNSNCKRNNFETYIVVTIDEFKNVGICIPHSPFSNNK
jgi:hypothetical protein